MSVWYHSCDASWDGYMFARNATMSYCSKDKLRLWTLCTCIMFRIHWQQTRIKKMLYPASSWFKTMLYWKKWYDIGMWRIEVGLPLYKDAAQTLTLAMQDVHKQQTENYCANVVLQKLMCHTKKQQRYKKLCVGTVYFCTPPHISGGVLCFNVGHLCVCLSIVRPSIRPFFISVG